MASVAVEEIVRPFQRPDVNRGARILTSRRRALSPVTFSWGDVGPMPTPTADDVGVELCAEVYKEDSRTTTKVRVENPDDSSQFVMVKQTNKMKLSKSNAGQTLQSGLTSDLHNAFEEFNATFRDAFTPLDANGNVDTNCDVEMDFKNG